MKHGKSKKVTFSIPCVVMGTESFKHTYFDFQYRDVEPLAYRTDSIRDPIHTYASNVHHFPTAVAGRILRKQ